MMLSVYSEVNEQGNPLGLNHDVRYFNHTKPSSLVSGNKYCELVEILVDYVLFTSYMSSTNGAVMFCFVWIFSLLED